MNGFIIENPINKMDDLGVNPLFSETSRCFFSTWKFEHVHFFSPKGYVDFSKTCPRHFEDQFSTPTGSKSSPETIGGSSG